MAQQAQASLRSCALGEIGHAEEERDRLQEVLDEVADDLEKCRNIIKDDKAKVDAGLWPARMLRPFATKIRDQLLAMATADTRSDWRHSLDQLSQHTATEWLDSRRAACPALVEFLETIMANEALDAAESNRRQRCMLTSMDALVKGL